MSRPAILIKDLVRGNQVWKMHIRVVDLWVVKEKSGQEHLEFVIQDAKADQTHVCTRNRDFKDWIEQIKLHETYYLYNGEPIVNDGPFKVCPNQLKLVFNGGTTVTRIPIPDIPPHNFNFKPIESFSNDNFQYDMLYDVIGVLQDVLKTQMGGGGRKSCANITLSDEATNVIEVALWDDYGKQFMNFNNSAITFGPIVIILTHAWCKKNTASGLPSLSNAWNGSTLHMNLNHPQVQSFQSRYLGSTCLSNALVHSLSQTCDSSVQIANKSWTNFKEVKSIRQINELGKDCFATTIGTTKRFRASKFGWFFEACPGCKTSNKSIGVNFECVCGVKYVEPLTKYKIEVEVEYENHVGFFVFWDKDCIPLIGITATKLRQVMKSAGVDNPKIYLAHLDKLLNRKLAFRIKYQSFYQQYSIVAIIKDLEVYGNLNNYLTPNEITQSAEETFSTQPSSSANQTWSPSTSCNNTPAKRVENSTELHDESYKDVLTPAQSATKFKHIKKE